MYKKPVITSFSYTTILYSSAQKRMSEYIKSFYYEILSKYPNIF